jgi:RND family efflux transporter MFP subunit
MIRQLLVLAACPLALVVLLAGCGKPPTGSGEQDKPSVEISEVTLSDSLDYEDFTGRAEAIESVEIKAQVTGYIDKVAFKDGDEVEKGALLYKIDDRTYKADLEQAEGNVQRLKASLERYNADLERARRMRLGDAMSREDYDKAVANKGETTASLVSAKATVDRAKLNVGFTTITAPISGKLSRTNYTVGNLVNKDQTTLTTIVSMAPIYVAFDVDERTALTVDKMMREKQIDRPKDGKMPVFAKTLIETGYPHEGFISFVDNKFDTSTGTIRVRATFPNKERIFEPGADVRVRVPLGGKKKKLLVSEQAISTDLGKPALYVVKDGVVESHPVVLGSLRDGMRVIEKGVEPGDWVIINGLQKVRPGDQVEATKKPMPTPPLLPGVGGAKGKS